VNKTLLTFIIVFMPLFSLAVSELNYASTMKQEILPYMQRYGHYQIMPGAKGVDISTFSVYGAGHKGVSFILPGQGEFIPKYFEIAYDFIKRGYSAVHVIDHRGQGTSPRIKVDAPEKGNVEEFSDYVDDLYKFIKTIRARRPGQKFLMLAYSMGAAISSSMFDRFPQEKLVDGIVFVAPMFGIQAPYVNDTRFILPYLKSLCLSDKKCLDYAPWESRFNLHSEFRNNIFNNSKVRWEMHKKMVQENPSMGINGPTIQWVVEATKFVKEADFMAPPRGIPMLILLATEDEVVFPLPQKVYCLKSKTCRLKKLEGSKHEMLQETDTIRLMALESIDFHFYWSTLGTVLVGN
jgi:lysophospholipase